MRERRQHRRVSVNLKARFLLQDGSEHVGETIDASLSGISFRSRAAPFRGQRVVAYVADLGRVEGIATRVSKDGFALAISGSRRRRDRMAGALTWAQLEEAGQRSSERIVPDAREGCILTQNALHPAQIVNVSRGGAAVRTASFLPLGTTVHLGRYPGIVLRVEAGLNVIAFERELPPEAFNRAISFQ